MHIKKIKQLLNNPEKINVVPYNLGVIVINFFSLLMSVAIIALEHFLIDKIPIINTSSKNWILLLINSVIFIILCKKWITKFNRKLLLLWSSFSPFFVFLLLFMLNVMHYLLDFDFDIKLFLDLYFLLLEIGLWLQIVVLISNIILPLTLQTKGNYKSVVKRFIFKSIFYPIGFLIGLFFLTLNKEYFPFLSILLGMVTFLCNPKAVIYMFTDYNPENGQIDKNIYKNFYLVRLCTLEFIISLSIPFYFRIPEIFNLRLLAAFIDSDTLRFLKSLNVTNYHLNQLIWFGGLFLLFIFITSLFIKREAKKNTLKKWVNSYKPYARNRKSKSMKLK